MNVMKLERWQQIERLYSAAQQWHEPDLLLAALVASGLCPALGGAKEMHDHAAAPPI
jgi:hypothetical protein